MRILAALFFILATPLVVLYSTILFGGITSKGIKDSLAGANVYETLLENISAGMSSDESSTDPQGEIFTKILTEYGNPEYIRTKVEGAIDDSGRWIAGGKEIPVVSFKDIKTSLLEDNPELFVELTNMSKEMKDQAELAKEQGQEVDMNLSQNDSMEEFLNSDFTFPLDKHLKIIKDFRQGVMIVFPITVILMLGALLIVWFKTPTLRGRMTWLGLTFVIAGLHGFVLTMASGLIVTILIAMIGTGQSFPLSIIVPVGKQLTEFFIVQLKNYQIVTSIGLGVIGGILFLSHFAIGQKTAISASKNNKKIVKTKK